jgi:bifunctional DNase/RNase
VVEVADLRERVRLAMDDLPPGQRAAVELFYVADRSYAETAERLGIGVGAVKTRLHKARTRLRRQLSTLWKEEIMATATKPIEMRCIDVRMEGEESDGLKKCVVVLQEVGGPQRLYIWVGQTEATAIAYLLEQEETPRPLTIAFAANLVRTLGGRLQEVRISRLEQEVFYAAARLEGTKGAVTVDARPSDAIALALSLGAPIRVEPAVLAATGITPEQAAAALEKAQFQERQGASQIVAEATERWRRGHTGRSREPEEKP